MITGQKAATSFLNEVDFVKLPDADLSFTRRAEFLKRSSTLGMTDENASHMRREIIDVTIKRFMPHALISDHSLTGLSGELVTAMNSSIPTVKYLTLRPVLGDAEKSRAELLGNGGGHILKEQIDRVIVTGDSRISSIREDLLPEEPLLHSKVVDVGFAINRPTLTAMANYRWRLGKDERPWIVCSAGAGFRNAELGQLLSKVASMAPNVQFDFVQGHRGAYQQVMPSNVVVHGFAPDLPMMHASCDLLLCHGGYNTLLEGMAGGTQICVIDCDWNDDGLNDERRTNVERISQFYPIRFISDYHDLNSVISIELNKHSRRNFDVSLDLDGLDTIAEILKADLK